MNLALYSGGTPEQNYVMDQAVFAMIRERNPQIIPFITVPKAKITYAQEWIENYCKAYISIPFRPVIIDDVMSDQDIEVLNKSSVLFITGGNTYRFLYALKMNNGIKLLHDFVTRGGLLIGFSAGAMLTTPSIELAGYPSTDPDINDIGLTDLQSLGFVKYEIFPHYDNSPAVDEELRQYTYKNQKVLYALPDGAGILVQGNRERLFGNIIMFDNGEKAKITCAC